jgi:benzoylformate decarboxylase
VLGTLAFRLYILDEPAPPVSPQTRVAVITADSVEAYRSQCELAIVAPVADACTALTSLVRPRSGAPTEPHSLPPAPAPPAAGERLHPGHVYAALAERLPEDAVIVEESPSSRPELIERLPFRLPGSLLSPANGALGFGMPGAIGLRMARPDRGVVGIIGDGSSMYAIQSVWSAARYEVGVVLIVMANGAYEAMDVQARARGAKPPWVGFAEVDIAAIARGFGCEAVQVRTHDELIATLDDVIGGLTERRTPVLVEIAVGI